MEVVLIASVGLNGELGKHGDLCWHIREDLKHFKEVTMGADVVMGRKTWESLPKRPLPGRRNIVISSQAGYVAEGADMARSFKEALAFASADAVFIIGGASVYNEAIRNADKLEITRIMASDPDADTFFPPIDPALWVLADESEVFSSPEGMDYRFLTYRKRN